jgi:hypothetical protein
VCAVGRCTYVKRRTNTRSSVPRPAGSSAPGASVTTLTSMRAVLPARQGFFLCPQKVSRPYPARAMCSRAVLPVHITLSGSTSLIPTNGQNSFLSAYRVSRPIPYLRAPSLSPRESLIPTGEVLGEEVVQGSKSVPGDERSREHERKDSVTPPGPPRDHSALDFRAVMIFFTCGSFQERHA